MIGAVGDTSVSNPESFIDEVNEEVRRDRLYQNIRRYGWIAVVVVLATQLISDIGYVFLNPRIRVS